MIELSSEARNAYEEMVASLEKGEGYEDQDEFPQNLPALQDTAQQTSESDEPEYSTFLKFRTCRILYNKHLQSIKKSTVHHIVWLVCKEVKWSNMQG